MGKHTVCARILLQYFQLNPVGIFNKLRALRRQKGSCCFYKPLTTVITIGLAILVAASHLTLPNPLIFHSSLIHFWLLLSFPFPYLPLLSIPVFRVPSIVVLRTHAASTRWNDRPFGLRLVFSKGSVPKIYGHRHQYWVITYTDRPLGNYLLSTSSTGRSLSCTTHSHTVFSDHSSFTRLRARLVPISRTKLHHRISRNALPPSFDVIIAVKVALHKLWNVNISCTKIISVHMWYYISVLKCIYLYVKQFLF